MSEENHLLNQELNDSIDRLSKKLKFILQGAPDDEKVDILNQLKDQISCIEDYLKQF